MIRKYLICGKQLFLASKKLEDSRYPMVELLLPIHLFWELETLLKTVDYMVSANEDPVLVHEQVQRVYRKIMKYAVHEKDRLFIHGKIGGPPGSGGGSGSS